MRAICFYFQVHQPFRLRRYRFFDIGNEHYYYDDHANRTIMRKVAEKCYLPTNQVLLDLINEFGPKFKVSFSISGTALDQMEMYAPDVLQSFQRLANTGCVEFLSETYSHSLSALKNKDEFFAQVKLHQEKMEKLFNVKPVVFRNTELIYNDTIGEMVGQLGYKAMITEGAKHILGWKSPNYLYYNAINPKLKLLLKNFKLSDDIAFRFSNKEWDEYPLQTEKYVDWLNNIPAEEQIVNLFMDYETFGEHQWADSGIFEFLRALPNAVFAGSDFEFLTPSEVADNFQPIAPMHVLHPISWADEERDLTAWLGNELQKESFDKLYELATIVRKIQDPEIQKDWKYLQTSDHFYYMCTKFFSDGNVHKYFSPYNTPYEAFINFMNVLSDFIDRLKIFKVYENQIEAETEEQIKQKILYFETVLKELKTKVKQIKTTEQQVEEKVVTKPIKPKVTRTKKVAAKTDKVATTSVTTKKTTKANSKTETTKPVNEVKKETTTTKPKSKKK